ncbi:MAG: 1-acyl-sn-glycerol-3-phosphate acyltransferase [Gammaproteobacteria bacterium]|nr:1-acyl-sn-glycerol-3-phosphate acyltransferase [Gammaproteobacteria bacterium]
MLITSSRIIYRSTFLFTVIIAGCLFTPFFQKGHMPRQSLSAKITCWWHKKMGQALGIPVQVFGSPDNRPTLFIANHISWFDIHAIGGILAVRFLSKAEVAKMPIMGWLASRAGTLYISRGGKTASQQAIQTMVDALKQDQNVILFAEGTTTDGNIKHFHSRLIQSAIDAGCNIQPIAIRYPHHKQLAHPAAHFIGDMSLGESLANILRAKTLSAEIHFLDVISTGDKSRGELAREAEGMVRGVVEKQED